VRDFCEIGPGKREDVDEMWTAWRNWCTSQGRDKPGTRQTFGRDLRAAVSVLKTRQGSDGRFYEGIALRRGAPTGSLFGERT
jgi:putative DNA primase/helicase